MKGKKWEESVLPECTCLGLNFGQFFISCSKIHHRQKKFKKKHHLGWWSKQGGGNVQWMLCYYLINGKDLWTKPTDLGC